VRPAAAEDRGVGGTLLLLLLFSQVLEKNQVGKSVSLFANELK
jgi:hypothetical protein